MNRYASSTDYTTASQKQPFRLSQIPLSTLAFLAILMVFITFSYAEETTPELLRYSNINQAQKLSKGEGVRVAVIDWQFDLKGEARLKYVDPVSLTPDEEIGILEPWHGEWMATIIHTIAPDAKIIPIKARSQKDRDYETHILEGIRYAADHGAVAVCSSMGPLLSSDELHTVIDYAEEKGVVFVDVHPEYVLDEKDEMVFLSDSSLDHRILHAGIVAVPKYRVKPEPDRDVCTWPYDLVAHYKDGWGFSVAPPTIVGVIALMHSVQPLLSPDEIRDIIRETAVDKEGFPVLDAKAAVEQAQKHSTK